MFTNSFVLWEEFSITFYHVRTLRCVNVLDKWIVTCVLSVSFLVRVLRALASAVGGLVNLSYFTISIEPILAMKQDNTYLILKLGSQLRCIL